MSKKVAENVEVVEMDDMGVIEEEIEMMDGEIKEKKFLSTTLNVLKKVGIPVTLFIGGIAIGKKVSRSTKVVNVTDVIELAEDVTEF